MVSIGTIISFGVIGAIIAGSYAVYRNSDKIGGALSRGLQTNITTPLGSWADSLFTNTSNNLPNTTQNITPVDPNSDTSRFNPPNQTHWNSQHPYGSDPQNHYNTTPTSAPTTTPTYTPPTYTPTYTPVDPNSDTTRFNPPNQTHWNSQHPYGSDPENHYPTPTPTPTETPISSPKNLYQAIFETRPTYESYSDKTQNRLALNFLKTHRPGAHQSILDKYSNFGSFSDALQNRLIESKLRSTYL